MTGITYPDSGQDVGFTFYALGRVSYASDAAGTVSYGYDAWSRVTSETRTFYGVNYTTSYVYDNAGKLTSMTYPCGRVVTYTVTSVTTTAGSTETLATGISQLPFGPVNGMIIGI